MHELSLSSAILGTVLKHAGGRRVTQVDVRVGWLRQVVPQSLEFYFGFVTRDTVCAGARLALEVVPARLACGECAREWELDLPVFRCPACGSSAVTVIQGNEFEVESIEIEEFACTAQR
jgi:hydrogenase nickel incorporation protein HypA/HybF